MNNMSFLPKLLFLIRRPQLIVVGGNKSAAAAEAIFRVLRSHFGQGNVSKSQKINSADLWRSKFLVLEVDSQKAEALSKYLRSAENSVLAVVWAEHDYSSLAKLVACLPANGFLVLNFDDEAARELRMKTRSRVLTFGLERPDQSLIKADFQASDIRINPVRKGEDLTGQGAEFSNGINGSSANFKIIYKGSIVPVWLNDFSDREQIYLALSAVAVGTALGINLVELSQALGAQSVVE